MYSSQLALVEEALNWYNLAGKKQLNTDSLEDWRALKYSMCVLVIVLCRHVCSTVSALWPATTPWACLASGRGSASCLPRDTSSPSRSSSGVRQMTTSLSDVQTALSMSGRWTQVRTGSACKMASRQWVEDCELLLLTFIHYFITGIKACKKNVPI